MEELKIASPLHEGPYKRVYSVKPYPLSVESIRLLYEKLSPFPVIFGKKIESEEEFLHIFMGFSPLLGDPYLKGMFWSIDDLETGVFYITNIYPTEADAHFSFFDATLRGRIELVKNMAQQTMDYYGFRRLNITVPGYANKRVHKFVKDLGAAREGVKIQSAQWQGRWFDEIRYAILNKKLIN